MKQLGLFPILVTLATPVLAQTLPDTVSPRVAHIETGVICAPPVVGQSDAPGTVAGSTNLIDSDPPFVSNGHRVPAVLGIGFGAKVMASTTSGLANVVMTTTHPPMGPDKVTSQTYLSYVSGLDPSLTFYQFDFDYELLPGTWQMTAELDGKVIYRTTFEVVPPELVPELATICGFEELLS